MAQQFTVRCCDEQRSVRPTHYIGPFRRCVGRRRVKKRRTQRGVADTVIALFQPEYSHELVCWRHFELNPVRPKCRGYPAQQALRQAGTIANGKVSVNPRSTCGHECLGLIARWHWKPGDVVVLYGGVLTPMGEASKTHARHDRGLGHTYVYDGLPLSIFFEPDPHGPNYRPLSPDTVLCDLIENCGIDRSRG
jgi:hypothetical protein